MVPAVNLQSRKLVGPRKRGRKGWLAEVRVPEKLRGRFKDADRPNIRLSCGSYRSARAAAQARDLVIVFLHAGSPDVDLRELLNFPEDAIRLTQLVNLLIGELPTCSEVKSVAQMVGRVVEQEEADRTHRDGP